MRAVEVFFFALWGAFGLYWLAAAVGARRPPAHTARYPDIAVRIGVIAVVVILRATVLRASADIVDNRVLEGLGSVFLVLGLAVAVWARVHIGRNWGMPMSEGVGAELVTTGPYRLVRHPIYSGVILAMIGTALAFAVYWLVVVALVGAYFVYSATVEERTMTRLFPSTYPAYRRSTWMLVPFVF